MSDLYRSAAAELSAVWDDLSPHWLTADLTAGETFHTPDTAGQVLYIVRQGHIHLETEASTVSVGPGGLFGRMPSFGLTLAGSATAVTDARLYVLSAADAAAVQKQLARQP